MNESSDERRERLEMLLVCEATNGLNEHEQLELAELLLQFPNENHDEFRQAAANFDLAFHLSDSSSAKLSMPGDLKQKIIEQAKEHIGQSSSAGLHERLSYSNGVSKSASFRNGQVLDNNSELESNLQSRVSDSVSGRDVDVEHVSLLDDPWRWMGWVVAIAATFCLVLLNVAGPSRQDPFAKSEANEVRSSNSTVIDERNRLLQLADTVRYRWSEGKTPLPRTVTGEVVWNQRLQQGFMTFEGLPMNDTTIEQYQLWIVDPSRDQHPIDGGVFNIVHEGTAIVRIDPKLRTIRPQAFAITIEKPGGVVVSDQSRLPLLAAVK